MMPLRIVVVGQEFGHAPARVGLTSRRLMVLRDSGTGRTFSGRGSYAARNAHMRGRRRRSAWCLGVSLAPTKGVRESSSRASNLDAKYLREVVVPTLKSALVQQTNRSVARAVGGRWRSVWARTVRAGRGTLRRSRADAVSGPAATRLRSVGLQAR